MVMPYYSAGSLYDRIDAGGRFSTGQVIELVGQVADALDYLHTTHKLLHRDVKPKNLLVSDNGDLILCDFGTAATLDDTGHTGPVRTTIAYQAPETAGQGRMQPASDVYGLGLVAIEMLDGTFLYEELQAADVQKRVDTGRRACTDAVLASSARPPHVLPALRALIARCVRAEPAERPAARALVRALNDLRLVDWRHEEGEGLDGRWIGRWPPRSRQDRVTEIEVTSRVLKAGRAAGDRRLEARYRRAAAGRWRSVGSSVTPEDVGTQDAAAVSRFFKIVSEVVAQRFPA
jgi:serine/threonine protein kinase